MNQPVKLTLSIEQVNLTLEALGQMPFARVYDLIQSIQSQASDQLAENDPKPAKNADES